MKISYIPINVKTAIIYTILALLAISIITALIFENQSDLIVNNTVLTAERFVYNINNDINKIDRYKNSAEWIKAFIETCARIGINEYTVFNDSAEIVASYPEKKDISIKDEFTNINRAIYRKENEGKLFYAEIGRTLDKLLGQRELNFYIAKQDKNGKNLVIKLPVSIKDIDTQMMYLYRQLGLLIFSMIITVALIAFIYNKIVIKPIKTISKASEEVAEGNYKISVNTSNRDEIGILFRSFNNMVVSLDTTTNRLNEMIDELKEQDRIVQHELDIAQLIQKGMLPVKKDFAHVRVAAYYSALEKISGDYYDFTEFRDGSVGIIIADASGHGIPAALVTIMLKVLINTYGIKYQKPDQILRQINYDISDVMKTGDYMTAFYLTINKEKKIRYANAGHCNAVIYRKRTDNFEELDISGPYIGLVKELPLPYNVNETDAEAGDILILYTDGITEQKDENSNVYGTERMLEAIKKQINRPIDDIVKAVIENFSNFSSKSKISDDNTLIVIEIK